jgi:outer membrane receptor protein involved in Fe transport
VPFNGGLGTIFITGLNTLGSNQFLPSVETSLTTQYMDNLTKVWRKHTTKFGFEHQHLRFTILQPPSGRGAWSFSGVYTEVPSSGGGNTGLAQMLLTPIKSTVPGGFDFVGGSDQVQASNYANTDMGRNYNAAYIQDDWKVSSKLTVNLGLRWEYFGQIVERYGASTNFQPVSASGPARFLLTQKRCDVPFSPDFKAAAATDNINIVCSSNPGLGESQKTNFGPRIGFAYRVTPKLVVRAGAGIFYGGFENSVIGTYFDFPFQFNLVFPSLAPNLPITFSNGSIGTLETGLSGVTPITSGAAEPAGAGLVGQDFHLKTPYTQSYNLTLQYQLTPTGLCRVEEKLVSQDAIATKCDSVPDSQAVYRRSRTRAHTRTAFDAPSSPASTSYVDCALSNSRRLNCTNSVTNPSLFRPNIVAASISVFRRIDVATSALHSIQYSSLLPGSSNSSAWAPTNAALYNRQLFTTLRTA